MGVCRRVALRDRKKRTAARGLPRPANIWTYCKNGCFRIPEWDPRIGWVTKSLAGILRFGKYSVKKKEYFL